MSRIIFVAAVSIAVSGCATITRGTSDQIQLVSEPEGARAQSSLGQSCVTPCIFTVSRKDEFTVAFQKDGYAPQSVDVKTQVAGSGAAGFAGNILVGGLIGMGTDAITGATLEHVPDPVQVTLVPKGGARKAVSRRARKPQA